MKKTLSAVLAAALICTALTGCRGGGRVLSEPELSPAQAQPQSLVADPQGALEEIYKEIDIKEISEADDYLMRETLGFDMDTISEYYVRYSSGRYGVADTYIIKPEDDKYEIVRESLEAVKLERIRKTEDYDVLGANKIAQDAKIFQYSSYIIMLMLEDNDAAEEIIRQYIPSSVS